MEYSYFCGNLRSCRLTLTKHRKPSLKPLVFRTSVLFLLGMVSSGRILSQTVHEVKNNIWTDASLSHSFNKKIEFSPYFSYRMRINDGRWNQVFINPTVIYSATKNIQLRGILVYSCTVDGELKLHELRPWLGAEVFFPKIKCVYIRHLIRLDERFFFDNDGFITNSLRSKYSIFAYIPLNHREVRNKTLYLWPSIEYYMDLAGEKAERCVNKSRYNLGMGYRFSDLYSIELCFLEQFSRDHKNERFAYRDRIFRLVSHFTLF